MSGEQTLYTAYITGRTYDIPMRPPWSDALVRAPLPRGFQLPGWTTQGAGRPASPIGPSPARAGGMGLACGRPPPPRIE